MSDGAYCHYCQRATCVCRDGFLFDAMKDQLDAALAEVERWKRLHSATLLMFCWAVDELRRART